MKISNPGLMAFVIFGMIMVIAFAATVTSLEDEFDDIIYFDHYKTDVNITIHNDGSATIVETYDFRWAGQDSGEMYRVIPEDEVGRISSITCVIDGVPAELVSYDVGSATHYGNVSLYSFGRNPTPYSNDWEINAFYKRATSGEHTVEFTYIIANAVTKYADCVEFYYKVFEYFSENLKDLTVTVDMPLGSFQDETYIFGHGDPNGHSEFISGTANSVFTSSNLEAYTMFEIRVVNQQIDLYPLISTNSNRTFDSIMAEEKRFQNTTDLYIMLGNIQLVLIIVLLLGTMTLTLLRFKIFKRNRPTFNHPYTREIPSVKPNIEAEFGSYYKLFKGKNFGNKIAATILNLALQKAIAIEKAGEKEIAFVSLNENVPMSGFERGVYNMIFSTVLGEEKVKITLTQLQKDLASRQYDNFNLSSNDKNEFDAGRYVDSDLEESNRKWKKIPLIPLILAFPIIVISIYTDFSDYIPYFFGALFVSFLIVVPTTEMAPKPLTVAGENEYAKAKALKKFYTDMTLMKERKAMELPLWEQHLVYATALGVADKVIKELDVRFTELNGLGLYTSSFTYLPVMYNVGLVQSMNSISRSTSYAAFVKSAGPGGSGGGYSSSGRTGGGGGFSGGGGGGFGGGGGGHR